MNNRYLDSLYKAVRENEYNLEVLKDMRKSIDIHNKQLEHLRELISQRIEILVDYEEEFREKRGGPKLKPIIAIVDGEEKEYKSASEASRDLLVSAKNISNVCCGRANTAGGIRFYFK